MKSLVESIVSSINEGGVRDYFRDMNAVIDLVKPIYFEKDIDNLFAKYGVHISSKNNTGAGWEKLNMSDRENQEWSKFMPANLYAEGVFEAKISMKEFDNFCKMLMKIANIDLIKDTKNININNWQTYLHYKSPIYSGEDKCCFISDGNTKLFIDSVFYDDKSGDTISPKDAIKAGNGDIVLGIKKLCSFVSISICACIDITDVAPENFVYDTTGAGGINDCTGTPIKVGDIVAYIDRSQLSIGKVISINKSSVTLVTNNTFGDKIDINGKKVHIVK